MFDSSMSAAAIVARVQELQAAAGIKARLVNPAGRGAGAVPSPPVAVVLCLLSNQSLRCKLRPRGHVCREPLPPEAHLAEGRALQAEYICGC